VSQEEEEISGDAEYNKQINISNPATWSGHIDDETRYAIVRQGPVQM
jgi:hypothetical protein